MSNILNTITSLLVAVVYYIKTAVSILTSNVYLMVGSLLLILTVGKSFKLGNIFSYNARK